MSYSTISKDATYILVMNNTAIRSMSFGEVSDILLSGFEMVILLPIEDFGTLIS